MKDMVEEKDGKMVVGKIREDMDGEEGRG